MRRGVLVSSPDSEKGIKMTKLTILKKTVTASVLICVAALLLTSCGISDLFKRPLPTGVETSAAQSQTSPVTDAIPEFNATPMDFSKVNIEDYIEIDYKGLKLTSSVEIREINNELVEAELRDILLHYGYYVLDTEGVSKLGDTVEMEYVGYMNGEEFSGGKSDKATILLDPENSGYIDGFADGLIGKPFGTEIELNLTFPENYYVELAGKPVTFKVILHGRCAADASDENASKLSSGEITTMAAYIEYLRDYLKELDDYRRFDDVVSKIQEKIDEIAVIKQSPEAQINYYYEYSMNVIAQNAASNGMTIDEYMLRGGYTEENVRKDAEQSAKTDLIFEYVIQKENIEMTDELYNEYMQRLVNQYKNQGQNVTPAQLEAFYDSYYGVGYLKSVALDEAVIYRIFSLAEIEYVPETSES